MRAGLDGAAKATAAKGKGEPQMAAPAIAQAARRNVAGCAVRGIETAAGRVAGVVTDIATHDGKDACTSDT